MVYCLSLHGPMYSTSSTSKETFHSLRVDCGNWWESAQYGWEGTNGAGNESTEQHEQNWSYTYVIMCIQASPNCIVCTCKTDHSWSASKVHAACSYMPHALSMISTYKKPTYWWLSSFFPWIELWHFSLISLHVGRLNVPVATINALQQTEGMYFPLMFEWVVRNSFNVHFGSIVPDR